MRRGIHTFDSGLAVRMFLVMFLLAALYLGFLIVLWNAGADLFTVMIIAAVLLGAQYFFSDQLVLWSMGARIVSPDEAPGLHGMIDRLVQMADMPKPRVAIVNSPMPNAFATGRSPSNAVVAVTTGIMDKLSREELEGVLAHELTHVRNRDVLVITLASFFATVAQLLLRVFAFGGGRRRDGGSVALVYLASIAVWIISFFLIRALSRYRELAADRGGAIITGAPQHLASALVKISGGMARIPERDLRQVEELNAFFIVPALSGSSLMTLFGTHPSLEQRLEQLQRLTRELEGV